MSYGLRQKLLHLLVYFFYHWHPPRQRVQTLICHGTLQGMDVRSNVLFRYLKDCSVEWSGKTSSSKLFHILFLEPLMWKLNSWGHRRALGDLSLFYRHSYGFCSDKLTQLVPPLHQLRVKTQTHRNNHYERSVTLRVSRIRDRLHEGVSSSHPSFQFFKSRINWLEFASLQDTSVRYCLDFSSSWVSTIKKKFNGWAMKIYLL